jgi:glycosyltransferase involved in cell wall biosynthesis
MYLKVSAQWCPKILIITELLPAPVYDGATRRTEAIFQILSERYELVCLFIGDEKDAIEAMNAFPQVQWRFAPKRRRLGEWLQPYLGVRGEKAGFLVEHYLLGDRARTTTSYPVQKLARRIVSEEHVSGIVCRWMSPAWLAGPAGVPTVVDVDDDVIETFSNRTASSTGVKRLAERWRNALVEGRYIRKLRAIEGAIFARQDDAERLAYITPTFHAPNYFVPKAIRQHSMTGGDGFIRVGLLAGGPSQANIAGAGWFAENVVAPILENQAIGDRVQFVFAGRMANWIADAFPQIASDPRAKFLGEIGDVSEFYTGTDIAVSPVLFGGGSSVKFFEALAFGMAVMATRSGARGYDGPSGQGVFVSDDPDLWVNHIRRLASSEDYLLVARTQLTKVQNELKHLSVMFREALLGACAVFDDSLKLNVEELDRKESLPLG